MRRVVKGLLAAAVVLALAEPAAATATAQDNPGPTTPKIIGGVDATENYSFIPRCRARPAITGVAAR